MKKEFNVGVEFEVRNDHFTDEKKIVIKEFRVRSVDMFMAIRSAYNYVNNYLEKTYDNALLVAFSIEEVLYGN